MELLRNYRIHQLKKEIRGSKEHIIVGVDVAKDNHNAFFGTATGNTLLKRLVFKNDMEEFNRLLAYTEAVKVKHALDKVVFGFDPTGNYHKPLGEYLVKCGLSVLLVSGKAVRNNREMLDNRWDKNDTKDSANIADLISQGKFMYYVHPVLPLMDFRGADRRRGRASKRSLIVRFQMSGQAPCVRPAWA